MSQPSFFEVEDTPTPHVRDMTVAGVTPSDVADFTERYHYSGGAGSALWRWGLWHGPTLYGVIAYNMPTRDACNSLFGPEHIANVWHMGRLAMADVSPQNSESRLIGGSLRAIQELHPHVWGVLTFADTGAGHIGYVYQATNAIYAGATSSEGYFVDTTGKRRSTVQSGGRIPRTKAESLGWEYHKGSPKHRYVYVLGDRKQRRERLALLRYEPQPYPKAVQP